MQLELDHVFILVEPHANVADLLLELGLEEGFSRDHAGQGTTNRRFVFANGMLEFLWLRDKDEAQNGPGRGLEFARRFRDSNASPFGLIVNRTCDAAQDQALIKHAAPSSSVSEMPFEGWTYQPDYFNAPMAFHIGANSGDLHEPLCIYVPFIKPHVRKTHPASFKTLTQITIHTPKGAGSAVLKTLDKADRLSILHSDQHLMTMTLDNHRRGERHDFRPHIPLVILY